MITATIHPQLHQQLEPCRARTVTSAAMAAASRLGNRSPASFRTEQFHPVITMGYHVGIWFGFLWDGIYIMGFIGIFGVLLLWFSEILMILMGFCELPSGKLTVRPWTSQFFLGNESSDPGFWQGRHVNLKWISMDIKQDRWNCNEQVSSASCLSSPSPSPSPSPSSSPSSSSCFARRLVGSLGKPQGTYKEQDWLTILALVAHQRSTGPVNGGSQSHHGFQYQKGLMTWMIEVTPQFRKPP